MILSLFRTYSENDSMKYVLLLILSVFLFNSCKDQNNKKLEPGNYRGLLGAQDQKEIPFLFEISSATSIKIFNAEEVIEMNDIRYEHDSVYIQAPVFEGTLSAKINSDGSLKGYFTEESMGRVMPFWAVKGNFERFKSVRSDVNVTGEWQVMFSPDSKEDQYASKGIFKQNGTAVTGTFRTNKGDYRFLEGVVDGEPFETVNF